MTDTNVYKNQALLFTKSKLDEVKNYVFGLGFIGSNLAYGLAKTGFKNIDMVDYDIIEEHNILNQRFPAGAIGQKKADILPLLLVTEVKNILGNVNYIGYNMKAEDFIKQRLDNGGTFENSNIFISVDSLSGRKKILAYIKKYPDKFKNANIFDIGANDEGILITMFHIDKQGNIPPELDEKLKEYVKMDKSNEGICGAKSAYFYSALSTGNIIHMLQVNMQKPVNRPYTEMMYINLKQIGDVEYASSLLLDDESDEIENEEENS